MKSDQKPKLRKSEVQSHSLFVQSSCSLGAAKRRSISFLVRKVFGLLLMPVIIRLKNMKNSSPSACDGKPDWLKEPTTVLDKDSNLVQARGIDVCKNPIAEDIYVQADLVSKIENIRSAIQHSCEATLALKLPCDLGGVGMCGGWGVMGECE